MSDLLSAAFRVCSSGYSDGTTAALAYDADGRLASLVNLATLTVVGYSYGADGQLAAEAFPGGGRSYTYTAGRLSGYSRSRAPRTRPQRRNPPLLAHCQPAPLPEKVRQKLEALLLQAQLILATGIGLIGVGGISLAVELSLMYGPALTAALGTAVTEGAAVATGTVTATTAYAASSTLWQEIITARTALLPGN